MRGRNRGKKKNGRKKKNNVSRKHISRNDTKKNNRSRRDKNIYLQIKGMNQKDMLGKYIKRKET
jgi:hypothetical protein